MPRNSPFKVPEVEESTRKSPRLLQKTGTVEIEINLEVERNDNDSQNESSSEEEEFEVEKVIKTRVRNGKTEYYVKWVGFDDSHNEWVDSVNNNKLVGTECEEEEEDEDTISHSTTRTTTTSSTQPTKRTKHIKQPTEAEEKKEKPNKKRVSFSSKQNSTSSEEDEGDDFEPRRPTKRATPEKIKKERDNRTPEQTPTKAKINTNNSSKKSTPEKDKGENKEVQIVVEIEDDDFEPTKPKKKSEKESKGKEKEKDSKEKAKEKVNEKNEEKTTPKSKEKQEEKITPKQKEKQDEKTTTPKGKESKEKEKDKKGKGKVEQKTTPKGKSKIEFSEKNTLKGKGKGKRELEEDPPADPHYNPLLDNDNNNNNNSDSDDNDNFVNGNNLEAPRPQYLGVDHMPPRGRFHRRSWDDLARFARVKPVVPTASKPLVSISFEESYSTPLSNTTLASFLPKPATTPGKKKRDRSVIEGMRESKKKFPTLQELCVSYLVKEIENVESFGLLPSEVQHNICKLMAKKGKLVPAFLHLFLENSIEILDLTNCSDLDEAALRKIPENCTELKTFRLSECGRFSDAVLSEIAVCCPLIVDFSLNGAYRLTDQSICKFIETHKQIKRFSLFWSYRLTKKFTECLVENCKNTLRTLILGTMTQINDAMIYPLQGLSVLTHLHLEGLNEVTDKSMVRLLESDIQKTLQDIKIIGLTQVGGLEFSQAVSNCVSLTSFTLEGSELMIDDFLLDILKNRGGELRLLSLSNNKLLTDVSLSQIWGQCPRLVSLALADLPYLTIESIKPILLFNPSKPSFIESLDISWCRAIDNDVLELFLKHLTKLKKMVLWGGSKIPDFKISLVCKKFGLYIIGRDIFL
eukprot:TRINITY_DN3039_c0_g2_i8.p1 TRINITY_DN3039_c0_g2~~TRINITY_DN3039_c0_g2_i8.p1  ORF type:complete len:860 (-),score=258.92 TRINITY_DN3039_c0_g2_i8:366-2945(-)